MKLSEFQLDVGLTAVGEFLTPTFGELSAWQQHELKKKLVPWLVPIMLTLPDSATGEELQQGIYKYELLEAAKNFELRKLRDNPLYDQDTDKDLRKRLRPQEVENSAINLTSLSALALKAIHELPADVQLATVVGREDNPLEAIQRTLEDPAALDEELARVLE